MLTALTSTFCPAYNKVSKGVAKGASTVDTEVMPTDKATSPLAKYVITFDEVPPGQVPTSITPNTIFFNY